MDLRRTARLLTPVLAAGALSLTAVDAPGAAAATRCDGLAIAAHRGVHDAAHTENTLRSARRAVALHADVLEGDMALTRDGAWVMMHDRTVDRTTNGRGVLREKTLAQVRRLRTDDGVLHGVPTVDAELAVVAARPTMQLQLEIKPSVVGPAALDRLFALFTRRGLHERLTVTSFSPDVVAAVRRRFPGWETALITDRRVSVTQAQRYGRTLVLNQAALTAAYAASLRGAGVALSVFTPNTATQVGRARSAGVASVVTDRVGTAQRYCG